MNGVHIIGAGGHARVILALCRAAGVDVAGVFDDDLRRVGTTLGDVVVRGPARAHLAPGVRAVVAIGNNKTRKRVVEELADLGLSWVSLVHPRAFVDASVTLGVGTVVFAGAVVQPDAVVGAHAILNTSCSVDHDARIGDFVHIAPGAHLAGDVTLDEGAFLGVGVSVIPGRHVGAWTTVGAGAAVVRDLPGNVVAVGVPARVRG